MLIQTARFPLSPGQSPERILPRPQPRMGISLWAALALSGSLALPSRRPIAGAFLVSFRCALRLQWLPVAGVVLCFLERC